MSEKPPEPFKSAVSNHEQGVGEPNYEGNESLLLLERLSHPRIRTQLIDLLHKGEEMAAGKEYTEIIDDDSGNPPVILQKIYSPKTREQIEVELEERIQGVGSYTPIEFSDRMPTDTRMTVGDWKMHGKPLTIRQKSIVEAHEKGHVIRPFSERFTFFNEHFQSGFDLTVPVFSEEDIKEMRENDLNGPEIPIEDIIEGHMLYLFSAMEIAERMAQLKNYFGMRGDETFTAEQLAYARHHYVHDTGLDNNMTSFFKAITPETEEQFLQIMNTSGI